MTSRTASALTLFEPVLARLEVDALRHFGIASLRLIPCEAQDRPASHILRVGVSPNDGQPLPHLFVKIFKPRVIPNAGPDAMQQRVARDFEATSRTYRAMAGSSEVGVVPPVACYPDLLALVTEEASGRVLLDYLHARASWLPTPETISELRETMARVGRWIRVFQQVSPGGGLDPIELLREYIDIRLERLVHDSGGRFSDVERRKILQHIDELGAAIAPDELRQVMVHSDMSLGNVLVSDTRVVVLDFAMTRLDNRMHDVTKVFVRVGLLSLKPHFSSRLVRDLQVSLLRGFDPSVATTDPLFRLLVLLHRVNHLTALYGTTTYGMQAAYDVLLRAHHWRWLRAELATPVAMVERR